jgi:ATP-dependent Clp protease adapter protein ClpS
LEQGVVLFWGIREWWRKVNAQVRLVLKSPLAEGGKSSDVGNHACPLLGAFLEQAFALKGGCLFHYNTDGNVYNDDMKEIRVDQVHLDGDHKTGSDLGAMSPAQVILYNDDHNTAEHIVRCLILIFGHDIGMAHHLTMEAHALGKTIAQVEPYGKAVYHSALLDLANVKSEVTKI